MNTTITSAAERFMRRMVRFGGAGAEAGFRLSVSPGGCSGYSSEFSIEPAPKPGDTTLDVNGLKVFLTASSRLVLEGVTVDFADTPTSSGLTFVNPSASGCGTCGTSKPGTGATATVAKIDVGSITRRS